MKTEERCDILVVGHYVHDTLIGPDGECHETLGGPPAYISAIFDGSNATYSVISKVGRDFKYAQEVRHAPITVLESFTTAFVNDYSHGNRLQRVDALCDPIFPDDLRGSARVGLACGVFNEILPETLLRLREKCDILVADIQGFLRVRHKDHSVGYLDIEETSYAGVLEQIDFLKVSTDEARFVDIETLRKHTQILLTKGERGCHLFVKDADYPVPGNSVLAKDETGAGDCFIAGFALGLSRGLDVLDAAKLGNCCGALAVQHVGIPCISKGEIDALMEKETLLYSGLHGLRRSDQQGRTLSKTI